MLYEVITDDALVFRHPFPGPGLSINVLCSTGDFDRDSFEAARAELAALTDKDATGFSRGRFIALDALPVKSVGVQGDFRTYRFPAVIRFAEPRITSYNVCYTKLLRKEYTPSRSRFRLAESRASRL